MLVEGKCGHVLRAGRCGTWGEGVRISRYRDTCARGRASRGHSLSIKSVEPCCKRLPEPTNQSSVLSRPRREREHGFLGSQSLAWRCVRRGERAPVELGDAWPYTHMAIPIRCPCCQIRQISLAQPGVCPRSQTRSGRRCMNGSTSDPLRVGHITF